MPQSLHDLTAAGVPDLLVVQNPGTSSPGLAFLLATIAELGEDGWQAYWTALRDNGVKVDDSWTTAYYDDFSGAAGSTGDRPLVVSYGRSPPAEVLGAADAAGDRPDRRDPVDVLPPGGVRRDPARHRARGGGRSSSSTSSPARASRPSCR